MALAAAVPMSFTGIASGMSTTTSAAAGLDLESFESQLGTSFLINNEAAKVKVKLVHVNNFASAKQTEAGKEGFSLLFRGSKETTLKQGTYVIEHEQLGKFTFLVVPVGTKDTRAPHYEAVINRLHS
jgi:Domain of unknown function (DUF6916)